MLPFKRPGWGHDVSHFGTRRVHLRSHTANGAIVSVKVPPVGHISPDGVLGSDVCHTLAATDTDNMSQSGTSQISLCVT